MKNLIITKSQKWKTLKIVSLFLLFSIHSFANETLVVGQVFNKADRTPLESVSVYFKGTNKISHTNEEGYFLIRNDGDEKTLIFSLIGFKQVELKVKPGEQLGTEILMEEKENLLGELMVKPGANRANDLMSRVVKARKNNKKQALQQKREQNLVLMSKKDSRWENNRIYSEFKSGNLSDNDTSLLVPLFMEELKMEQSSEQKQLLNKNTYNTSETAIELVGKLLQGLETDANFYNNSVLVMGKSMISPLANVGRSFYRYYLIDSIQTDSGKEYLLWFRSKNTKNLAFNGEMRIDSATLALTYIDAELPRQANLNYIHNLQFNQDFSLYDNKTWLPKREISNWDMTYELLKRENQKSTELFIRKKSDYDLDQIQLLQTDSFANTPYSEESLEERMLALQQHPFYKTANFIAHTFLTGNFRAGPFDIGPIIDIARWTKIEGVRLGLPIQTNEHLSKHFMVGGHAMYGFRDQKLKYAASTQFKLPIEKRFIIGAKYLNDYRRIDYDYNNFIWREDPLETGDENIMSTFLSFRQQHRMNMRQELTTFIYNDWGENLESKWIYRDVKYISNELLPLQLNGENFDFIRDRNFSFTTRFSFDESIIDKHFQRIYVKNPRPIIYTTIEGGHYNFGNKNGNYGRFTTSMLHRGQNIYGDWRYSIEAGKYFGDAPYPLLKFIQGKGGTAYNRYEFALMNSREYLTDTYIQVQTEYLFNGILFNRVPLIKHLNLREIVSFKAAYGTLSDRHKELMNIPNETGVFTVPYSEASVGIANLLGVLSVQSIWRLSDLNKSNINKWGIKVSLLLAF